MFTHLSAFSVYKRMYYFLTPIHSIDEVVEI